MHPYGTPEEYAEMERRVSASCARLGAFALAANRDVYRNQRLSALVRSGNAGRAMQAATVELRKQIPRALRNYMMGRTAPELAKLLEADRSHVKMAVSFLLRRGRIRRISTVRDGHPVYVYNERIKHD